MKFKIKASAYKAVALAQSKEKSRYSLCGVFVERQSITATNGHILLKYNLEEETGLDAVGYEPFIMSVDTSEKGFAPAKNHAGELFLFGDTETLILEFWHLNKDGEKLGKRHGVCGFEIIDGTFPDYKRVIPDHTQSEGCRHIALDAGYIQTFQKADKLLGGKGVIALTLGNSASSPILINLGDKAPIIGVQMPCKSAWE